MRVAATTTGAVAFQFANMLIALAHDNGIDLSDKVQDQVHAVIAFGISAIAATMINVFHGWLKKDATTLAHENIALAQANNEKPSPVAIATVGAKQ